MKSVVYGFYDPFTDKRELRGNVEKAVNTLWGVCLDKGMHEVIMEGSICEGFLTACAYTLDVNYTDSDEIHNFVALVKNMNETENVSTKKRTFLN